MKSIEIEEALFPGNGVIRIDENNECRTIIVDAELDPFECHFHSDGVTIHTSESSYVMLTMENLVELMELMEEAGDYYDSDGYKNTNL